MNREIHIPWIYFVIIILFLLGIISGDYGLLALPPFLLLCVLVFKTVYPLFVEIKMLKSLCSNITAQMQKEQIEKFTINNKNIILLVTLIVTFFVFIFLSVIGDATDEGKIVLLCICFLLAGLIMMTLFSLVLSSIRIKLAQSLLSQMPPSDASSQNNKIESNMEDNTINRQIYIPVVYYIIFILLLLGVDSEDYVLRGLAPLLLLCVVGVKKVLLCGGERFCYGF